MTSGLTAQTRFSRAFTLKAVLDTANGSDIVLWLAIRHHHEPRFDGEEAEYLPYHYEEFHLTPRGFDVLRVRDQGHDRG
jgi:hypothetical protein